MTLVDRKYLYIRISKRPRPDGRKRRLRNSGHSIYLQFYRLEMVVWYK